MGRKKGALGENHCRRTEGKSGEFGGGGEKKGPGREQVARYARKKKWLAPSPKGAAEPDPAEKKRTGGGEKKTTADRPFLKKGKYGGGGGKHRGQGSHPVKHTAPFLKGRGLTPERGKGGKKLK